MDDSIVEFTIAINDPELDAEEQQKMTKNLLRQLKKLDEVERVERTEDLNPEEGGRPGIAFLMGMLTAEVNVKNIKAFLGFLGDRLGNKPIKLKVKVKDTEVELEAKSRQELLEAERIANELLASMQRDSND
jgi:hypothetical protein